jgi:hypothetical protein
MSNTDYLSSDLLSGFTPELMSAAHDGDLELRHLGGLLHFIDHAHIVSQGLSAMIDLHRIVTVSADLEEPFPVDRTSVSAMLDLAAVAVRELTARAEALQKFVNDEAKVCVPSKRPKSARGADARQSHEETCSG